MTPVPVTVVTGCMGSGKTTLLNHILKSPHHGVRFAIIENEFGGVGEDEAIVESADEELVELNGCVCCTVRSDLVKALKSLYAKNAKFDSVLIETGAHASPGPVAQTFFVDEFIRVKYKLDGICTVVDAGHVLQCLDEVRPEGARNEVAEQLAFADRIVLNKTDLVRDDAELDRIEARIKAINLQAPIFRCQGGMVDPKYLIKLSAFDLDRVLQMDAGDLNAGCMQPHNLGIAPCGCRRCRVSSCSCKFEGELNINKLQDWISELIQTKAVDLLRYRGVLALKGMEQKFVFQGVHMLFSGGFKDAHWRHGEARECRFVFIGRDLDGLELMDGLLQCKAEGELRFKLGDEVEANVGTWMRGRIVRLWDDGNPYRIELADEEGTNVYGPQDNDYFVRVPRGMKRSHSLE